MGVTTFWKANKRGYTTEIGDAGVYSEDQAQQIVDGDVDKRTVKVEVDTVKRLIIDV